MIAIQPHADGAMLAGTSNRNTVFLIRGLTADERAKRTAAKIARNRFAPSPLACLY